MRPAPGDVVVLPREGLSSLVALLRREGRTVLGPTMRDGAIMIGPIQREDELPIGWTDQHAPGRYGLAARADAACFGYIVGPQSPKATFFPPLLTLLKLRREPAPAGGRFVAEVPESPPAPVALLGVRACDLAAIAVQDRVFLGSAFTDPAYASRRRDVLIVAVQCAESRSTCFCASMGTGPRARAGFDLALTELLEPTHRFVVEVGTPAGAALAAELSVHAAEEGDLSGAQRASAHAAATQTRSLKPDGLNRLLFENLEHPRWDHVAQRCLSCTNCTMVCPTCFCSAVSDTADVTDREAQRVRRWDSCFTAAHSHVHGGSIHGSTRARYRQWLTHKLGSWVDQFGTSGCTGCGRCITFCPVGIDLTEEIAAIAASPVAAASST